MYIHSFMYTHTIYVAKANDYMVVVVQLLSLVQLFVIPWTAACQPFRHLPELAQTHVHQVSDAIQPSHPLLSPSPPVFNFCKHQGLFQ